MKAPSLLEQLKSILLLPFMVTVVLPYILLNYIPSIPNSVVTSISNAISYSVGITVLTIGLLLFVQSVVLFIKIGRGTLAPWNPTRKLVIKSLYRHVRNPMILGVLFILFGEAMLFKSLSILLWALLFLSINHIYFIAKEEPDLHKRFGNEYEEYRRHVPRWLPRINGWRPEETELVDSDR